METLTLVIKDLRDFFVIWNSADKRIPIDEILHTWK